VVVVGDFYWRLPLLFGFMLVVASSCLSLGCVLRAELFFLFD